MPVTMIESVVQSLRAASRHAHAEVAPATVLWTDAEGQWRPIATQLRPLMPELLVFRSYPRRIADDLAAVRHRAGVTRRDVPRWGGAGDVPAAGQPPDAAGHRRLP